MAENISGCSRDTRAFHQYLLDTFKQMHSLPHHDAAQYDELCISVQEMCIGVILVVLGRKILSMLSVCMSWPYDTREFNRVLRCPFCHMIIGSPVCSSSLASEPNLIATSLTNSLTPSARSSSAAPLFIFFMTDSASLSPFSLVHMPL